MKKYTKLLSVLLLLLAFFAYSPSYGQAKKYVLFEHFTNVSCGPCAQQNPVFQGNILNNNKGRIHHISYHPWWPSNTDPMYLYNTAEITDRTNFYNVTGVPTMVMLGNQWRGGPAGVTQSMVNEAASESSPIRIIVRETSDGTTRYVRVVVHTVGTPPSGSFVLRNSVIESWIHYTTPPGTNGEKDFPNVFRDMLPNTTGDTYTPAAQGDSVIFNYQYALDLGTWDTTQIYTVSFISEYQHR